MPNIRLDKYISSSLILSRKDAAMLIRKGKVCVDGLAIKQADTKLDPSVSKVTIDGKQVDFCENLYIMLNKPKGLVCSTEDARDKTVLGLFDSGYLDKGLFPCGRLDKDTTGLLLLTTDGALSHKLLSPKHHAKKLYHVVCDKPFVSEDIVLMKNGILMDGKTTKPALLEILSEPNEANITLTEGKFHEIKRLCFACGQKEVVELRRLSFGGIPLDETLSEGEWRMLTSEEIAVLQSPTLE